MVSSPVQNLSAFVKTKPPIVVFLLCLVALAVSTFYFAFEIEKDGPTVDSDKIHDWISMLKHFNKLDTCISLSTWKNKMDINNVEGHVTNVITVHTKVTIENVNSLKPFYQINGALSLQGWYSTTCQDSEKQPSSVEIFFDVPSQIKSLNGSLELCVSIKGPAEFLPLLKNQGCEPLKTEKKSKDVKGYLVSKRPKDIDTTFCADGTLAKLNFDLTEANVWNYLSDDVRTEIYVHLMWCSYILVFFIFCILLYAILKKSEYLEKREHSERLL